MQKLFKGRNYSRKCGMYKVVQKWLKKSKSFSIFLDNTWENLDLCPKLFLVNTYVVCAKNQSASEDPYARLAMYIGTQNLANIDVNIVPTCM